ncbi:hypothetical protein ACIF80_16615 [Streptomyces sp. NPDC085927]|uniref:hypothetical protein n=1 Tax=Streptomyces sp. NPDC085927 TaxID=3365738 RepID=UPI0037D04C77
MTEEAEIVLKNYDWMLRHQGLDQVELDWDSRTLVWGGGGSDLEDLCRPGFTPATDVS